MRHAHHVAFLYQRHRVVGQLALDQRADAVNLFLGDRRQDAVVADDLHDAVDLQNADAFVGHEPRKYVAGEQRPVDLLLAILPAAPLADGREENVDVAFFCYLVADDLFMARSRPDRESYFLLSKVPRRMPDNLHIA